MTVAGWIIGGAACAGWIVITAVLLAFLAVNRRATRDGDWFEKDEE